MQHFGFGFGLCDPAKCRPLVCPSHFFLFLSSSIAVAVAKNSNLFGRKDLPVIVPQIEDKKVKWRNINDKATVKIEIYLFFRAS